MVTVLIFGGLLPVLFVVYKYWKRTHVGVNCWFCGLKNIILRKCQDGWVCKHCEQYNGFKSDGDYNRDIPAQWDSSLNGNASFCSRSVAGSKSSGNGLCYDCNRNQELKVAQLASFQPINPENFDFEIENYSYHLERAYRLCPPCESVLEDTLSSKKTHILDINLQLTGKGSYIGTHSTSKGVLNRALALLLASMLTAIAAMLGVLKLSTSSNLHQILDFFHEKTTVAEHVSSNPLSLFPHYLASPSSCLKEDTPPFRQPADTFYINLNTYLMVENTSLLPLCLSGVFLQGVSVWHSGFNLSFPLWIVMAVSILVDEHHIISSDLIQISQIIQVILYLLVVVFCLLKVAQLACKSLSPSRKPLVVSSSKRGKRKPERVSKARSIMSHARSTIQVPQTPVEPSVAELRQDQNILEPHHSTPPARPASVLSSHTLTSAAALNKSLSSSLDTHINANQEDASSDASVDSAFSNTDSITLDGADPLLRSQYLFKKKKDSQDDDVHSLIEGLSIGSLSSRRNPKRSEFKTQTYVKDNQRSSLLSPPKLTNVMNGLCKPGPSMWRNNKSNMPLHTTAVVESPKQSLNESAIDTFNETLNRPSSPCRSGYSQAAVQSGGLAGSFCHQLFPQVTPAWNSPVLSRNSLSVCVTPTPLAASPGFGNIPSPLPNSPVSQVIYTPYGLFHQMVSSVSSPGMFMMSPQSPPPPFSNRSPSSTCASQFSPHSFSTSSLKDLNSFCDSDANLSQDAAAGRTKSTLSSSFFESVWQSRFAIMYTTLCYLLLGSVAYAFSHFGLVSKAIFGLLNWKQNLLATIS